MQRINGKYNKTLIQIFEEIKKRFSKHNLTFEEIHLNTNIPVEMLQIYFSEDNTVIEDLSKIVNFSKINLHTHTKIFKAYKIYEQGNTIKITRIVEPKCSMYYSRATQDYYRFAFKKKRFKGNEMINKELIINEMDEKLEIYLKNNK
jgi:hypothetical protein